MSNDNDTGVPEGMPTFENCPDWGKGGRYIYDPVTQTRTRADDEPEPAPEASQAAPVLAITTENQVNAEADADIAAAAAAGPAVKPPKEKARA